MTYSQHSATATASDGSALGVVEGSVTLDDTWSPYAQAELRVVSPVNAALTDPRVPDALVTLELRARYGAAMQDTADASVVYHGLTTAWLTAALAGKTTAAVLTGYDRAWNAAYRAPTLRTVRLRVRKRVADFDGTSVLSLASDEALLQDLRALSDGSYPLFPDTGTTLRDVLRDLFARLNADTPYRFTLADGPANMQLPEVQLPDDSLVRLAIVKIGQTWWDFLTPFLQLGNLRLWCDPLTGVFQLTAVAASGVGPQQQLQLATGPGGNIVGGSETIDLDSELWGDAVLIDYAPNPADPGALHQSLAAAAPYRRVLYSHVDANSPVNQFTDEPGTAAENVLARTMQRGRVLPVDALSDYTAEPGQPATVAAPTGRPQVGTVQAVTHRFPQWEMTVTTRNLEDSPTWQL